MSWDKPPASCLVGVLLQLRKLRQRIRASVVHAVVATCAPTVGCDGVKALAPDALIVNEIVLRRFFVDIDE
jgi:predicted benzoate:H+ symporter BenE